MDEATQIQAEFLKSISQFRPMETIFEVGKKGIKTDEALLMKKRRTQVTQSIIKHKKIIAENRQRFEENMKDASPVTLPNSEPQGNYILHLY